MARKRTPSNLVGGPAGASPGDDDRIECPFQVLVDSREQKAYQFLNIRTDATLGRKLYRVETIRCCLSTGDYQIPLMPELCLERKSLADLYGSIGRRKNWEGRLESISDTCRMGIVLVEAELSTVISHPPPFTKIRPKTVSRTIIAWRQRYPKVHWLFLPNREWAEAQAFRELERWYKDHQAAP